MSILEKAARRALLLVGTCLASPLSAAVELGTDLYYAALSQDDTMLRTHSYLYVKAGPVELGPMVQYERPHYYVEDTILGLGVRVSSGGKYSLEIGGGRFERDYTVVGPGDQRTVLTGQGAGVTLVPSYKVSQHVRLSMLIVGKKTVTRPAADDSARQLPDRWEVEAYPTFGFVIGI